MKKVTLHREEKRNQNKALKSLIFELECLPLYLYPKSFTIDFWGELASVDSKRKGYMDCSPVRVVRGTFFMSETHTSEVERVFLK